MISEQSVTSLRNRFMATAVLAVFLGFFVAGCEDQATDGDDNHDECGHWTYSGDEGPDHWQDLCAEYSDCGGQQQSPINITGATADAALSDIFFNYDSSTTAIVNNGHTVQWNVNGGSSIQFDGTAYSLLQFHLHTPSEHTVDGASFPMELHLVHKNEATGNLAVVGVLFEVGDENPFMTQFMDHLPASEDDTYDNAALYLASDVLPEAQGYYTYPGSLTTPPCSEIVTWLVLQTPVTASQAQLDDLAHLMHTNNRPTQVLNGRAIRSHQ